MPSTLTAVPMRWTKPLFLLGGKVELHLQGAGFWWRIYDCYDFWWSFFQFAELKICDKRLPRSERTWRERVFAIIAEAKRRSWSIGVLDLLRGLAVGAFLSSLHFALLHDSSHFSCLLIWFLLRRLNLPIGWHYNSSTVYYHAIRYRLQCKQPFVDSRAGQLNLFAVISACLYRSSGRTSLFATQVFSMSSCKAISLCHTVWSVDGSSMCVEALETCRVGSLWIAPCSQHVVFLV